MLAYNKVHFSLMVYKREYVYGKSLITDNAHRDIMGKSYRQISFILI